jgi:hypothetical protein
MLNNERGEVWKKSTGKDLEGSGDGIIEVLSRNLPREGEENHENRVPAEIQTQCLTVQDCSVTATPSSSVIPDIITIIILNVEYYRSSMYEYVTFSILSLAEVQILFATYRLQVYLQAQPFPHSRF